MDPVAIVMEFSGAGAFGTDEAAANRMIFVSGDSCDTAVFQAHNNTALLTACATDDRFFHVVSAHFLSDSILRRLWSSDLTRGHSSVFHQCLHRPDDQREP